MDALRPKKRPSAALDANSEDGATTRPHDPLVTSVMEEEQAAKQAKKGTALGEGPKGKRKRKGLTLEEVEKLEGDTVKESQVGMAASRRADKRKQTTAKEGTGLLAVSDLVDVEEALEQEEDDGFKLEPFNLAKEREEGHFDEGGNYVEHKEEDDPSMRDAWLTSEDAGVVSEAARRKIEAQKARLAAADAAPEITPRQVADLMRQLVEILQPKETPIGGLRRLRPNPAPLKKGRRAQEAAPQADKTEASEDAKKLQKSFDTLTEVTSTLMDAGELDIYSTSREELQRRADKFPVESDDFDMFGEPSSAAAGPSKGLDGLARGVDATSDQTVRASSGNGAAAPPTQAPSAAAPLSTPQADQAEDSYSSWPVKELSRFLRERGVETAGITEKADLVARVKEVASQGPEGEQASAPPGYAWDPASGYFLNRDTGMYFDAASGSYYTPADGKWWSYDAASRQFLQLGSA